MLNSIFLIPSFYGFCAWVFMVIVYLVSPIQVNDLSFLGWMLVFSVVLTFALSFLAFRRAYSSIALSYETRVRGGKGSRFLFYFCVVVGFIGLLKYYLDFSKYFGGLSAMFLTMGDDPLAIRALAAEDTSIGFQLSYFSWIAFFVGLRRVASNDKRFGRIDSIVVGLLCVLIFLLNLGFIDRTRPIWLLMVGFVAVASARQDMAFFIRRNIIKLVLLIFVIFVGFSLLTGKYGSGGVVYTMIKYIIGGLPYLDSMINELQYHKYIEGGGFALYDTFYPIAKVLYKLGVVDINPTQILSFKSVPFMTNVGTFVQPFVTDGGVFFALLGVPLLVVIVDYIALMMLRKGSDLSLFVWANMIFMMSISFFVPKHNSSAVYLFLCLYLLVDMHNSVRLINRSGRSQEWPS